MEQGNREQGRQDQRDRTALVHRLENGLLGAQPRGDGRFDLARRGGYDQGQVDAHVAELNEAIRQQARRADEAEHRLAETEARLGQEPDPSEAAAGFGSRIEKILRTAEAEAAEARETATRDAGDTREKARADAEAYRHQAEQDLIARSNKLDSEAADREHALNQREHDITEKLDAAQAEAERIKDTANREAKQTTDEAERQSRHIIGDANQQAEATRVAATSETERLAGVRDGVYGDLDKLHRILAKELDEQRGQNAGDDAPKYPDHDTDADDDTDAEPAGAGAADKTARTSTGGRKPSPKRA